jgi:hypothetical protein
VIRPGEMPFLFLADGGRAATPILAPKDRRARTSGFGAFRTDGDTFCLVVRLGAVSDSSENGLRLGNS